MSDIYNSYKRNIALQHSPDIVKADVAKSFASPQTDDEKAAAFNDSMKKELDLHRSNIESAKKVEEPVQQEAPAKPKEGEAAQPTQPKEEKPVENLSDLIKVENGKVRASDELLKNWPFTKERIKNLDTVDQWKFTISGGILKAAENSANFALRIADAGENFLKEHGIDIGNVVPSERSQLVSDLFPDPDEPAQRFARTLTQFAVPMSATSKLFAAGKGAGVVANAFRTEMASAAAGMLAFDPDEKRLADFFKEDLDMAFMGAMLFANEEGDSEAKKTLNLAMESLVTGGVLTAGAAGVGKALSKSGQLFSDVISGYKEARNVKKLKEMVGKDVKTVVSEAVEETAAKTAREKLIEKLYVKPIESESGVLFAYNKETGKTFINIDTAKIAKALGDVQDLRSFRDKLTEETRGRISFEYQINRARNNLQNEDNLKAVFGRKAEETLTDDDLATVIILREGTAQRVLDITRLARTLKEGDTAGREMLEAEFLVAHNLFEKSAALSMGKVSRAARVMNTAKNMDDIVGGQGKVYANILSTFSDQPQSVSEMMAITENFLSGKLGREFYIEQLAKKGKFVNMAEWTVDTLRSFAVSAIGTQVRNIVSTGAQIPVRLGAQKFAEILAKKGVFSTAGVANVAQGEALAAAKSVLPETQAQAIGTINALRDHVLAMTSVANGKGRWKNLWDELARVGGQNLDVDKVGGHVATSKMRLQAIGVQNETLGHLADIVDYFRLAPYRSLGAADDAFRQINASGRLEMLAIRHAENQGLTGKAYVDAIEAFKKNPPLEAIADQQKYAKVQTFTDDLDGAYKTIDDFANKNFATRAFLLFTKTPLNIAKEGIRYTPLPLYKNLSHLPVIKDSPELVKLIDGLPFFKDYEEALKRGGADAQEAAGKALFGSAMMGLFMAGQATTGAITGSVTTNSQRLKELEMIGIKPYSIMGVVPYDKDSTFGRLMALSADLMTLQGHIPQGAWDELALGAGLMFSKFMTPELFVNGMSEANEILEILSSGGDMNEAKLIATFQHLEQQRARLLVPGIMRELRKTIDPKKKVTNPDREGFYGMSNHYNTIITAIMNDLPFNGLNDAVNRLGEDVFYPPGYGPDVANAFFSHKEQNRPIHKELGRLGLGGGIVATEFKKDLEYLQIKSLPKKIFYGESAKGLEAKLPVDIELTRDEYAKYTRLAAGIGIPGVPPILDRLDAEVTDPNYKDLSLADKMATIKEVFSEYKQMADDIMREDPAIADRLEEKMRILENIANEPDVDFSLD